MCPALLQSLSMHQTLNIDKCQKKALVPVQTVATSKRVLIVLRAVLESESQEFTADSKLAFARLDGTPTSGSDA